MEGVGGRSFAFFIQAEDGMRYDLVTGVQTCALPIFVATLNKDGTVKSVKPVMNGFTDLTVPSLLSVATTMSPPIFLVLFHEPWRAMKMAPRYSLGNMRPV